MPHFTTTDGVRLHFTRYGNPSPQAQRLLVLCPSNTTLTELQPLISGPGSAVKLDRDFSCLIFDYRGIGKSSKPGEPTPWPAPSMELFVNDVLELLNHVGWTSCHIIAFSFGAAVAQELLLQSVSAFTAQRVLLVCPAGDIDVDRTGAGSVALHELLELDTDHRLERMLLLADTRRTYSWLEGEQGQAAMFYLRGVEDNLGASSGALEGRKFQYLSRKGTSTFERLGRCAPCAFGRLRRGPRSHICWCQVLRAQPQSDLQPNSTRVGHRSGGGREPRSGARPRSTARPRRKLCSSVR